MVTMPAQDRQPERDFLLPSALRSQCLDILVTGTSNSEGIHQAMVSVDNYSKKQTQEPTFPHLLVVSDFKPLYLTLALALTLLDDDTKDEIGGLAGLILECVRSCNADVRPLVVQNILCVGGGSMVPGREHETSLLLHDILPINEIFMPVHVSAL